MVVPAGGVAPVRSAAPCGPPGERGATPLPAERELTAAGLRSIEVALLLLEGVSLREITTLRETSERTVRQQSPAVYRKAGLAGRAELSSFFLEDLLSPPT